MTKFKSNYTIQSNLKSNRHLKFIDEKHLGRLSKFGEVDNNEFIKLDVLTENKKLIIECCSVQNNRLDNQRVMELKQENWIKHHEKRNWNPLIIIGNSNSFIGWWLFYTIYIIYNKKYW